ncbi:MAG: hypothetical protein E6K12_09355 [Methanobacteriota archaeon]|nr:MAG: hypothetical protein E6K12_09355 [Euryarchaeota archaeon]
MESRSAHTSIGLEMKSGSSPRTSGARRRSSRSIAPNGSERISTKSWPCRPRSSCTCFRSGVELRLGTDNAMINVPSMLREIEFAYRVARMRGGVPARDIFEMALHGRQVADRHTSGAIRVGEQADLVVFDLPGGLNGFASLMRASASDVSLVVSGGRMWPSRSTTTPRTARRRRT